MSFRLPLGHLKKNQLHVSLEKKKHFGFRILHVYDRPKLRFVVLSFEIKTEYFNKI